MTTFKRGDRVRVAREPYYTSEGETYPVDDLCVGDTGGVRAFDDDGDVHVGVDRLGYVEAVSPECLEPETPGATPGMVTSSVDNGNVVLTVAGCAVTLSPDDAARVSQQLLRASMAALIMGDPA